jgi:hypothetical protein
MNVTISLDQAALDDLNITTEQFEQAVSTALKNLSHPESGAPISFKDVSVKVMEGGYTGKKGG